ncbi:autophagy protein Apg9-domain-containing protein [Apiosordaria backusii]|uniref:Autophagy-related protein 9 n=1 Tax=Apiosordaria backusii TaxID=314023 RepID=A0AA40AEA6_9PEZI|nr:autophagy protein Apg9-domain-containing protein [Apiosordaria backusii]
MAPKVFSKMPSSQGRSFYEELRGNDSDGYDEGSRAGLLDEENLNQNFQDYDLDHVEGLAVDDSRATLGGLKKAPTPKVHPGHQNDRSTWLAHDDDADNDVPPSLLVEPRGLPTAGKPKRKQTRQAGYAMPGSSNARAQWETTQAHQPLHNGEQFTQPRRGNGAPGSLFSGGASLDAKKMAEWRWANVQNLDKFIKEVYDYYIGCGIKAIVTERVLHLVNVAFIAVLLTFLTQCVDYSRIRGSQKLSQIIVPQCTRKMSGWWNVGIWLFTFYFIWKSIQYILDLRRLFHVRDFYIHLLNIPDHDMQTITWQEVVARVMALRNHNSKTATALTPLQRHFIGSQSKERLDASDIANRLMRRENYLIALFNKDILDLTIPIPFLRNRQYFSRTLEWTLMFSVLDMVFDEKGQVNQKFLRSDRRGEISEKLRSRFRFAGAMILVLSPFVSLYLVIYYFLMYYHEIQKNPSMLSSRSYTPLAEWKFREFNELPHLFQKRLDMSRAYATHYMDQFPKIKTEMVARSVAFVSGALATVLAIASVFDPELFLGFEITPDRTVLFYTAVFGSIWAVAHGMVSEEDAVFDPEYAMRSVIEWTHYEPDHWKDRLHSYDIKLEFAELYKPKVVIFLEEILGILTTPFVLFYSLPKCSDQIIDFFREFTLHIDGLGYVCTFAEFDFKKTMANAKKASDGGDVRDDYYSAKHGKMEASYYGFMGNYGNFALNPKPGPGSHLPPGMRNQFHPPPAWPSLNSPPLGADMQASRMGRSDFRTAGRASAQALRSGPSMVAPSPMASILLDPHHLPPPHNVNLARASHPHRAQHNRHPGESNIIEESLEDDEGVSEAGKRQDDEEMYGQGDAMDESAWQTSPARTLSRGNSAIEGTGAAEAGVVDLIYQFNQAQFTRRPGGV